MKRAKYHIIPHKKKGWAVKKEGAQRISGTASTKTKAIKKAKKFATSRATGTAVIVHGRSGRIKQEYTFRSTKDPLPPKN